MKKTRIASIFILLFVFSFALTACVNRDLAQGVNRDERHYNKPAGYDAYIYKEGDVELPYRFRAPAEVKEGEAYPLVIFLHGSGERGKNNRDQLEKAVVKALDERNCYVFMPQCPKKRRWIEEDILAALDHCILKMIEDSPVDIDRVYITGLSMGGYGTTLLVRQNPQRYAAAMCVSGVVEQGDYTPYLGLPMRLAHGSADKTVPVGRSRNFAKGVQEDAGGTKLIYTEYEGVGHNAWDTFYGTPSVWDWLFAQTRAS